MGLLDSKKREYVEQFDPEWERQAREARRQKRRGAEESGDESRNPVQPQLGREERRIFVFGAMRAALLLALIYAAAAAVIILLILLVYHLHAA